MLGIGPTELVVVAILFLIIFGPSKMPQMARDIGKFVGQARGAIDEFKDELTAEEELEKPARNREEGSRRRKDRQSRANGSSREDEEQEEANPDSDSESTERERVEYDL